MYAIMKDDKQYKFTIHQHYECLRQLSKEFENS